MIERPEGHCTTYDAPCINEVYCRSRDACCAGDPECQPLVMSPSLLEALCSEEVPSGTTEELLRGANERLAQRLLALETTIAEQRRVGRALAARVRREGGYASTEDQVALWEAEQLFGVEPVMARGTR